MRVLLALVLVLSASAPLAAQTSSPAAPAQPGPASPAAQPTATDARGFEYNPQGRRDPFVSLLGRGATTTGASTVGQRAPGLAGLDTAEVALKGTMQTPSGNVAMLQGSDGRTYVVRPGDKLRDGAVRAISQTALVIVQDVSDPLSRERQREVRKTIRQTVEAN